MNAAKVVGLLVGFAGIVLVSAGAFDGHISAAGVAYAVLGALVWAIGTVSFSAARTGSTSSGRWRCRSSAADWC